MPVRKCIFGQMFIARIRVFCPAFFQHENTQHENTQRGLQPQPNLKTRDCEGAMVRSLREGISGIPSRKLRAVAPSRSLSNRKKSSQEDKERGDINEELEKTRKDS